MVQQVEDPALSLLWLVSLPWRRFNPCPRSFHMPQTWPPQTLNTLIHGISGSRTSTCTAKKKKYPAHFSTWAGALIDQQDGSVICSECACVWNLLWENPYPSRAICQRRKQACSPRSIPASSRNHLNSPVPVPRDAFLAARDTIPSSCPVWPPSLSLILLLQGLGPLGRACLSSWAKGSLFQASPV